jgi:hypothetical protein
MIATNTTPEAAEWAELMQDWTEAETEAQRIEAGDALDDHLADKRLAQILNRTREHAAIFNA